MANTFDSPPADLASWEPAPSPTKAERKVLARMHGRRTHGGPRDGRSTVRIAPTPRPHNARAPRPAPARARGSRRGATRTSPATATRAGPDSDSDPHLDPGGEADAAREELQRLCLNTGCEEDRQARALYCSDACRMAAHRERKLEADNERRLAAIRSPEEADALEAQFKPRPGTSCPICGGPCCGDDHHFACLDSLTRTNGGWHGDPGVLVFH
jgi:hypothetical protein